MGDDTEPAAKDSHCSYCGHAYEAGASWPRRCSACGRLSYLNPLPVAVALVPVDDGLLVVRRDVEPNRGALALPGGFIDLGESWQQAAVREVAEETGVRIDPDQIRLLDAVSAPDGTLLVFGLAPATTAAALPASAPTAETTGWELITAPTALAFPLHTAAAERFFRNVPAAEQTSGGAVAERR
jgi:ADP-ribose pyrophosphatase YjhB (NUDIX family)